MKVWAIWIKPNSGSYRYIDSVWVSVASLTRRTADLKANMEATGFEAKIWHAELTIEDAELVTTPRAQAAESSNGSEHDPQSVQQKENDNG